LEEPAEVKLIDSLPLLSVTLLAWMFAVRSALPAAVPLLLAPWMAAFSLSTVVAVVSLAVSVIEIWLLENPAPESS
jgi:hypothetical protein